ncbi:MAG: NapC/NirT family cytochrome c [Betaproteobacteria bacterium]
MTAWLKSTALRNTVTLAGVFLTTFSALLFLVVFLADLFGMHTNPYIGIVFFLILPGFFLLGLALIPAGVWLERRRRREVAHESRWPRFDLNDPALRTATAMVFALTLANIVIVSLAAYRGIEYMDSVQFCGQVCHKVMQPEYAAYQDGAHSRVRCVECHIGSGASWFAKSKLSGTRQVFAVAFNTYSRPIPSPVPNLRPARDTCEQCHWPDKFHGDLVRKVYEYGDDEKNTESVTTLQMHVGGGAPSEGPVSGIHWHVSGATEIEYIATDDKRQVIPYVRVKDRDGTITEYYAEGVKPGELAKGERRVMDCMDCHNRPAHPMETTAERAVNDAMSRGEIPATLPFVHREAVKALQVAYPSQDAAADGIARALRDFYRTSYGQVAISRPQDVEKAVQATQAIYRRNAFPAMQVGFGTYPNNIGHMDSPGCFRCHDDSHVSKDGRKIGQDCDTCHSVE